MAIPTHVAGGADASIINENNNIYPEISLIYDYYYIMGAVTAQKQAIDYVRASGFIYPFICSSTHSCYCYA